MTFFTRRDSNAKGNQLPLPGTEVSTPLIASNAVRMPMSTNEMISSSEVNKPYVPTPIAKPSAAQLSQQVTTPSLSQQLMNQLRDGDDITTGPAKMDEDSLLDNYSVKEHFQRLKLARKLKGIRVGKVDKKVRLNQRLEKVIRPKNALLLFNELQKKPKFTVRETNRPEYRSFVVTLEVDGKSYEGEARSVHGAKMIASDMALRDIFAAHLMKSAEANAASTANGNGNGTSDQSLADGAPSTSTEDKSQNVIPWSVLGSYAVHLLFNRWEMDPSVLEPQSHQLKPESTPQGVSVPRSREASFWDTSCPRSPTFVHELIDCPIPREIRSFPKKPPSNQVFGVLNFVFPGIPIVEHVNSKVPEMRFKFLCKVAGVVYESSGPKKKPALQDLAFQILKTVGIEFDHEETTNGAAEGQMVAAQMN